MAQLLKGNLHNLTSCLIRYNGLCKNQLPQKPAVWPDYPILQMDIRQALHSHVSLYTGQHTLAYPAPIGFNYLSYLFTTARRYLPAGVLALVYGSKVWA